MKQLKKPIINKNKGKKILLSLSKLNNRLQQLKKQI